MARSTILLAMERSLQLQYGIQNDAKALWNKLKENYKSNVKLNIPALQDERSAMRLREYENVQDYASKILSYVNHFNHCADTNSWTSSGTMPKSKHTYYLMKGVPMDHDWRFFTQLMYHKIDTLGDKLEAIVTTMNAHKARHQPKIDLESIEFLALGKMRTKSEKRSSKHSRKSLKSCHCDSQGNGSSSESQNHRRRHWTDTQECSRSHQVGHIARYCPNTAPVASGAPTEAAAAAAAAATTVKTTPIENNWMTVTGKSPEQEGWYLDCATTSNFCGDQQ
jgi:hypothetical protein